MMFVRSFIVLIIAQNFIASNAALHFKDEELPDPHLVILGLYKEEFFESLNVLNRIYIF